MDAFSQAYNTNGFDADPPMFNFLLDPLPVSNTPDNYSTASSSRSPSPTLSTRSRSLRSRHSTWSLRGSPRGRSPSAGARTPCTWASSTLPPQTQTQTQTPAARTHLRTARSAHTLSHSPPQPPTPPPTPPPRHRTHASLADLHASYRASEVRFATPHARRAPDARLPIAHPFAGNVMPEREPESEPELEAASPLRFVRLEGGRPARALENVPLVEYIARYMAGAALREQERERGVTAAEQVIAEARAAEAAREAGDAARADAAAAGTEGSDWIDVGGDAPRNTSMDNKDAAPGWPGESPSSSTLTAAATSSSSPSPTSPPSPSSTTSPLRKATRCPLCAPRHAAPAVCTSGCTLCAAIGIPAEESKRRAVLRKRRPRAEAHGVRSGVREAVLRWARGVFAAGPRVREPAGRE
ncbi:hypothetical protein PsYK624_073920 [Phanerochaete sordida]|uniref:Uncharacterized protein n=1 Tax=Phanerochaete sordida TaxID=48140 RepID=A0A9P3LE87_9APHY|nr:hypothetical protein PsYK624_073920 [Phanerochaete sordida]